MKIGVTFLVIWITGGLLLFSLGDFNTYIQDTGGKQRLKEFASFDTQLLYSVLISAIFSLLNTGLLYLLHKINSRRNQGKGDVKKEP